MLLNGIFSTIWEIATAIGNARLTASNWNWPFNVLQYPLYALEILTWSLLNPIADLGAWTDSVADSISTFVSSIDVFALLSVWLDYASSAWEWIRNAWDNTVGIINSWWQGVSFEVLSWIDAGIDAAETLIGQVSISLGDLREEWDDFWILTWPAFFNRLVILEARDEELHTVTLPELATWTGVASLLEGTLRTWFPFYDDLVRLWGDIAEFIDSPLDWIFNHFEAWFWGEDLQ